MKQQSKNHKDVAAFASDLADLAGTLSLKYFRKSLDVEHKADASPVTIADRTVESAMREKIEQTYPDHGIFGEEHGKNKNGGTRSWILDPIDGTKSFITGMPTFGTLIAHLENGVPMVGLIDIPAMRERWLGVAGQRTLFNNTPCQTSGCDKLANANLYATSPDYFDTQGKAKFERVCERAAMRRFGGDCYTYGLLASGHVDVVMEMSLEPYDFLALVPVIECAGGCITDWQGKALSEASSGHVVATASKRLHEEVLLLINE